MAKFGWWAKEGAGKVRKWEDGRENDGRGKRDDGRWTMEEGGGTRDEKKLRRVEAKKVRKKEGREDERIKDKRLNG